MSAFNTDDANAPATGQRSRFSSPMEPSQPLTDVGPLAARPTARAEEIFSQARQVNWEADSQTNETARIGYGNIPIPTTEPMQLRDGLRVADTTAPQLTNSGVQPAIAVGATKPEISQVRPAVHLGLSDASAAAPAAKHPTSTVKSQFTDFGTAPARINISSTTSPLNSQR